MIVHLLIGALTTGTIWFLSGYADRNQITLIWWQWVVTILGVLYSAFVLEVIFGFLVEGVPKAALVIGLITGIAAVIWGVLLGRFVFSKPQPTE